MNKEPKKKQDLSVEEILKSIKGVIDNRDSLIQASDDDILELTNIIADEENLDKSSQSEVETTLSSKLAEEALRPPLISDKSATETSNILHNFSETAKEVVGNSKVKTLEDLIIEIIRPELSQWLDKNLPSLVRELVEKEIQRLIPNNQK